MNARSHRRPMPGARSFRFFCLLLLPFLLGAQKGETAEPVSLEEAFRNPPAATRPFVYWYWVNNDISREGIIKDLQTMAAVGIGGVNLAHIEYKDNPYGGEQMFGEEWWECMILALEEAARLGIEVNLFNSPGWSGIGGAWVSPEQAMRFLNLHEYRVKGPQTLLMRLPAYESKERVPQSSLSFQYEIDKSKFQFQPVAVQALPLPKGSDDRISMKHISLSTSPGVQNAQALFDGQEATAASFSALPVVLEIETDAAFTLRSLEAIPAGSACKAWIRLDYRNEKGEWTAIASRPIQRNEPRIIAGGFMPFAPVVSSFPAVTAKRFRLILGENEAETGLSEAARADGPTEKFRLAEIKLCAAARITDYVEKQLGHKAAFTRAGLPAPEAGFAVPKDRVINLTPHINIDGVLTWDVPEGDWILHHAGMLQTGVQTHPVPVGPARGFAADVLSREAVRESYDAYIGRILRRIPPENRRSLKRIVLDSYEQGTANWTDGMADRFQEAYGYDPMPFLPVLKGHVIESAEQSERFLWDLRRLVADLLPESYPGILHQKSIADGLTLWHEPYGGHGFPGEFLQYGKYADMPAGEFWMAETPGRDFGSCRAASSAARVYDRAIVSVEAFTSAGGFLYKSAPRNLKVPGDWAMAQGINHFTLHVSVHQPGEGKPGINTWYGTEFNRQNNWFPQSKSFVDYLRRSCALLQRGQRLADIAFYIGDELPCDKPALPYPLPPGFDLDFLNYDALMSAALPENGRLTLASGASYRHLVLPPGQTMRPEMLQRLAEFVRTGGLLYGPRPQRSPSRKGYPACDETVRQLADGLWGAIDGTTVRSNAYGQGKVFFGTSLSEFLEQTGLEPDVRLPEEFVFTHRREKGADLYFVANQRSEPRSAELSFRIHGRQPELWDPLTGETRLLPRFAFQAGRTSVPLEFSSAGSCFIVFRKETGPPDPDGTNHPPHAVVKTLSGPWNVLFADEIHPPFTRVMNALADWTTFPDPQVRYFSGKATYSARFSFSGKLPGSWFLNLGRVESLAAVRLNGKDAGTAWCYPYRIRISDSLVWGENQLEIDLFNPWWNRLVGDEQPGAVRQTAVSARLFWKAGDPLLPAGLLGPVRLEAGPEN